MVSNVHGCKSCRRKVKPLAGQAYSPDAFFFHTITVQETTSTAQCELYITPGTVRVGTKMKGLGLQDSRISRIRYFTYGGITHTIMDTVVAVVWQALWLWMPRRISYRANRKRSNVYATVQYEYQ